MHHSHHNSLTKFHFQHSLEKCSVKSAVIDSSLNKLILNEPIELSQFNLDFNYAKTPWRSN